MESLQNILVHYPEVTGIHPACASVPYMSDEELQGLTESVRERGLLNPIILTNEGFLLDGRHRLIACYQAMEETRFERTAEEPWAYVLDQNIKRRHLTVGQKAMFGQAWFEYEKEMAKERQKAGGGDKKSENAKKSVPPVSAERAKKQGEAREIVARKAGVGKMAIDKAKTIIEHVAHSALRADS